MATAKSIKVDVYNMQGEVLETKLTLKGEVFNIDPHKQAMYNAVRVQQSNARQATAKTKKRDEVSGGGKKPWRQKGTGRARAGSTRSPLWTGGGTVFGPTGEQNYKIKQNKKEHDLALKSALSYVAHEKDRLRVLDELTLKEAKTKELVNVLKALKSSDKVLIVYKEEDEHVLLSARNISNLKTLNARDINVYDLLNAKTVILVKDAVKVIEEALA